MIRKPNPLKDRQAKDPTFKNIFVRAQNHVSFFVVILKFVWDFLLSARLVSHEVGCKYNPDRGSSQCLRSTLLYKNFRDSFLKWMDFKRSLQQIFIFLDFIFLPLLSVFLFRLVICYSHNLYAIYPIEKSLNHKGFI